MFVEGKWHNWYSTSLFLYTAVQAFALIPAALRRRRLERRALERMGGEGLGEEELAELASGAQVGNEHALVSL